MHYASIVASHCCASFFELLSRSEIANRSYYKHTDKKTNILNCRRNLSKHSNRLQRFRFIRMIFRSVSRIKCWILKTDKNSIERTNSIPYRRLWPQLNSLQDSGVFLLSFSFSFIWCGHQFSDQNQFNQIKSNNTTQWWRKWEKRANLQNNMKFKTHNAFMIDFLVCFR